MRCTIGTGRSFLLKPCLPSLEQFSSGITQSESKKFLLIGNRPLFPRDRCELSDQVHWNKLLQGYPAHKPSTRFNDRINRYLVKTGVSFRAVWLKKPINTKLDGISWTGTTVILVLPDRLLSERGGLTCAVHIMLRLFWKQYNDVNKT